MAAQRQGRPRDGRVDHAIASAVRELLTDPGYARLTIDAVAARAGIGKAAIYRRHATKQEMIFAVLVHGRDLPVPPDRGSLRGDLAAVLDDIVTGLVSPPPGTLPGLLADVHADPALVPRFAATFVAAERGILTEILDRAAARGEISGRPDVAVLHATLLGPVFAWLFLFGEPAENLPMLTSAVLDSTVAALCRPAQSS